MYLALTNGTTTVVLNYDGVAITAGLYGAVYFPTDGGEEERVTETINQVFNGTVVNVRSTVATISTLLSEATARTAGNRRIPALYLAHNPVNGPVGAYRSEVLGGQVAWSPNKDLRQLHSTNTNGEIAIIIERKNYFEDGVEVSSVVNQGIVNGNGVLLNVVSMNAVQGTLPTPLRYKIQNISNVDVIAEDFYINVDTFVNLGTTQHYLAGDTATWGAPLPDNSLILESDIPDAVLIKCAGEEMSIIAAFTTLPSNVYLRAAVYTVRDGLYLQTLRGKEVYSNGRLLINLGNLPLPASGSNTGNSGTKLGIVARCATVGSATLDFQQIMPARGMINLTYNDYDMVDDGFIFDDGEFAYYGETTNKFDTVYRSGGPLMVWPNRNNRISFLMDEGTVYDKTRTFAITTYYNPRRRTV